MYALTDGIFEEYCQDHTTATETTIITYTAVTTSYFMNFKLKVPYSKAQFNMCMQSKFRTAISKCASHDLGSILLSGVEDARRNLVSGRTSLISKTLVVAAEELRAEGAIISVNISNIKDNDHYTRMSQSMSIQNINAAMLAEGLSACEYIQGPVKNTINTTNTTNITLIKSIDVKYEKKEDPLSSCFPAASQVLTPNGPRRMDDLVVGDYVLTSAGYRTVMYFGHADPHVITTFYNLQTSTGQVIKATALHDILVSDPAKNVPAVKNAKTVQRGDKVWVFVNETHQFLDVVEEVYQSTEAGIFTPRTETNDVVVDNILASCDTSDMRMISSNLHSFMRTMYFLVPSVFIFMDKLARDPSQLKISKGMTFWLPQQMVLPFFNNGWLGEL
jgi:hypothetical protein